MQIDEIPSERRPLADLHVHTTASDGTLTPVETVHAAASAGLMAVGISDHDTVAGVKDALEAGAEADVLVVPAIEINTDFGESEVHMLGYFIDIESATMLAHLVELREHRLERARLMVEKLNEIGVMVPFERVLEIAGTGSVGRPHIARAIVEAGGASGMNGAFGKFLVKGAPAYVPRFKLTPFQALDIIRSAGGVASMAHPGSSKHDELIPQLVAAGMQALECYHTPITIPTRASTT